MAKTLDYIINKVPPATVNNPALQSQNNALENENVEIREKLQEEFVRITAEVPKSVKMQMRERIYRNPDETERTIILKALRAYGFNIHENHLIDQRKVKKQSN